MQVSKEVKKGVIHWDRIHELKRIKEDGEVVTKGSTEGDNVLRIRQPSVGRERHFITVDCSSQKLLSANLTMWPSAVSDDGKTIDIWFHDFSLGRKGEKRKFLITFYNAVSAETFFESYTQALLPGTRIGGDYWELRIDSRDDEESEDEAAVRFEPSEDSNSEGGEEGEDEGGETNSPGDDAVDELTRIMELEANWGHSQSLFNPVYPNELGSGEDEDE